MTRRVARTCKACGADQPRTEAPDPCLGRLPDTDFACCGHGIQFFCYHSVWTGEEQITVRGDEARAKLIALGGKPAPFTDTRSREELEAADDIGRRGTFGVFPGWTTQ